MPSELSNSRTASSTAADTDAVLVEDAQTCVAGSQDLPGCEEPPSPSAETASAHTNTPEPSNRLIRFSPSIEVVNSLRGHAPSVPEDYSASYVAELERYKALVRDKRFGDAAAMCRERLLSADTEPRRHRWVKDFGIVYVEEGKGREALDVLVTCYSAVAAREDTLRAKYDNTLGQAFELLADYDRALNYYTSSRIFHELNGNTLHAAEVDNNVGRVLTAASRFEDAAVPLERALRAALKFKDLRLERDVRESIGECQMRWAASLAAGR